MSNQLDELKKELEAAMKSAVALGDAMSERDPRRSKFVREVMKPLLIAHHEFERQYKELVSEDFIRRDQ